MRKHSDVLALCVLLAAFLAGLLYVSPYILPVSGNWQLIDAIKIAHGEVLYQDVYTVSPPVIYVVALVVYKIFGTALWWYRIAGSVILTVVFGAFYFVMRRSLQPPWALIAVALAAFIYVRTPWEIFFTYLYMAYGFTIASYLVLHEQNSAKRYTVFGLFMGLAWMSKITIGGMGAIAAVGTLTALFFYDAIADRKRMVVTLRSILGTIAGVIAGYLLPFGALYALGAKSSVKGSFALIYAGGTKGSIAELIPRPFVNLWKYAQLVRTNSDLSSLRAIFETAYSQIALETFIGFVFVASSVALTIALVTFLVRRDSAALHSRTAFIAVSSGAIAYASAMSNVFDTDSIFIVMIFALFATRLLIVAWAEKWPILRSGERLFYALLLSCSVALFAFIGFNGNDVMGVLAIVFWCGLAVLLYQAVSEQILKRRTDK